MIMVFYIKQALFWMAGLAGIGFLRSGLGNRPNTMLVNLGDKVRHWLAEDTIIARFSLLFLPLLAAYNFLAWVVFGIQSIFELILSAAKWVWWLLNWIWDEVIRTTVFPVVQLAWHYLAITSWRFFEFGFAPVRRSVATNELVRAGRKLLTLFLLIGALAAITLLTSFLVVVPAVIAAFFLLQNTQFRILHALEPEKFPEPNIRTARRLTGVWLLLGTIGAALLALTYFFGQRSVSNGLGVTVTQAGIVLGILAGSGFASASTCIPPHLWETGGTASLLSYLKTILFRLPKLLVGQPFQLPGLVVVSLIPVLLGYGMNLAIGMVTGKNVRAWSNEIVQIQTIPPGIYMDLLEIDKQQDDSIRLEVEKAKALQVHDKLIDQARSKLKTNEQLLSAIRDRQIHTFVESPLTGDIQFFSISPVPSSNSYDWEIRESDGDRVASYSENASDGRSSLIEHRWVKEGDYIVTVSPRNSCGKGEVITRQISVTKRAISYFTIPRPTGREEVCAGEEATYTAKAGSGHYEWQIPSDASILSDQNQNKIQVKFGNQSGTVRVRVADAEGRYSLWIGRNVRVLPTPGNTESAGRYVDDEAADDEARPRAFVFRTREEGKAAVAQSQRNLADQKAAKKSTMDEYDALIHQTQVVIASRWDSIILMVYRLIGALLAIAGLALLAAFIAAAPALYLVQYHFNLFGFAQEGKHYWEELLASIRVRNAMQPLLGIFILLTSGGLYWYITHDPDAIEMVVKLKVMLQSLWEYVKDLIFLSKEG